VIFSEPFIAYNFRNINSFKRLGIKFTLAIICQTAESLVVVPERIVIDPERVPFSNGIHDIAVLIRQIIEPECSVPVCIYGIEPAPLRFVRFLPGNSIAQRLLPWTIDKYESV